jgi:hypothetical protein
MTGFDHKVMKSTRIFELRVECSKGHRTIMSDIDYDRIKEAGNRLRGKIKRDEELVITTSDGYEICRWM